MRKSWLPCGRYIATNIKTKLAADRWLLRYALLPSFCLLAILIQIDIVITAIVIVLPLMDALPYWLLLMSSTVPVFINVNSRLTYFTIWTTFIAAER